MDGTNDVEPVPGVVKAPKKKKVIKKVIRKVSMKQEDLSSIEEVESTRLTFTRSTRKGSELVPGDDSVLRSMAYYISETRTDASEELQARIADTMESGKATTDTIGVIFDSAARYQVDTGHDASTTLGLSDGTVMEECILPRLLRKLTLR